MATVKDEKGRFVKATEVAETPDYSKTATETAKDEEIARLKVELEAATSSAVEDSATETSTVVEEKAKKPSLRLQSKYRDHRIMVRHTRRVIHPVYGVEIVPGLAVRFEGPQRIFDSEFSQQKYGWTDDERDQVERKLVSLPEFMNDFYPAPMSRLPDHLAEIARIRPPAARLKCQAFGFENGELKQCPQEASAGRQWCHDHDPDVTRILKGIGTTVG